MNQQPLEFKNCTLYLQSCTGNIVRIDARAARIATGVPSTRYAPGIRVDILAPKQRRWKTDYFAPTMFLVALSRKDAVVPSSFLATGPIAASTEVSSRYAPNDQRWTAEFLQQLAKKGIIPLYCSATAMPPTPAYQAAA